MSRSVGLILACAGLIAVDAKADEAPLRARLRFSSPAGCGDAADFGARVQRREPRVRFGARGPDSVSVRIAAGASGLDASVTLASGGRRISERKIEAETCEDALDALALVVAVTLEGQERKRERARRSRAPIATPAPESAPETAPAVAPSSEPAVERPVASPEPSPPVEAAPTAEPAPEPPPPPPSPPPAAVVDTAPQAASSGEGPRWRTGAGGGAAFNLGAAPSLMPGWLVYGRFGWEITPPWSPELIISFSSLRRDGFVESSGSADFQLQTLSAELCPLRWRLGAVAAMPCALVAYGRLEARGYDTFAASRFDRAWTLLGASAQLAGQLSIIELRAQLGAGFPLLRDTFRFEPEPTVHHVPPVSFQGSIAAGLSFP